MSETNIEQLNKNMENLVKEQEEILKKERQKMVEEEKEKPKKRTRLEVDLENLNYSAKELMSLPENEDFKIVLQKAMERLTAKHFLSESKVQEDLDVFAETTAFSAKDVINIREYETILNEIQKAKDRVSNLYYTAISENNFVNDLYDCLLKVWTGKFSKLSSDKRREGEAELILSWIWFTKIERKNIVTMLKLFHENLNSKSEIVSRKITIYQEANRIGGSYVQYSPEDEETLEMVKEGSRAKARGKIGWGDVKK